MSAQTRYKRRVFAYKSVLARAGFAIPKNQKPYIKGLFGKEILEALKKSSSDNSYEYEEAAKFLKIKALVGNNLPLLLKLLTNS